MSNFDSSNNFPPSGDNTSGRSSGTPFYKNPAIVALIGGAVLVLTLVFALISYLVIKEGVKSAGNKLQNGLEAQYNDNLNYLSDCVVRIRESAGVAEGEKEALTEIFAEAVAGRYDEKSSAEVGQGQLFSAITEAYPDLSDLSGTFDKVMIVVNGCRTDFRDMQTAMQDRVRLFEDWRQGTWKVRTFGGQYPTDALQVEVDGKELKGEEALDHMDNPVAIADASEAFDTGTLEAEDPFGTRDDDAPPTTR